MHFRITDCTYLCHSLCVSSFTIKMTDTTRHGNVQHITGVRLENTVSGHTEPVSRHLYDNSYTTMIVHHEDALIACVR